MEATEGSGDRERGMREAEKFESVMYVPGVTQQFLNDMYDAWAKTYERTTLLDKEGTNFGAFKQAAQATAGLFPPDVRDKVIILDVGAGTGLVGQKLKEAGFLTMDALDPSSGMLQEARDKKVYRNFYNCPITAQPLDIPADTYDAVVMAAAMHHGGVQCEAFEEMIRIVKPGGYIVNCSRVEFLEVVPEYVRDWQPTVTRLEKEGKWKVVRMERYPNHYQGKEGLVSVFKVC